MNKSKSKRWRLHSLIAAIISHGFKIKGIRALEHAIQFRLKGDNNLKVNWYRKNGYAVPQGKKSRQFEKLDELIKPKKQRRRKCIVI